MSSDFQTAVNLVLTHEGGLVDDPNDSGGLTNFGISLHWHPELGEAGIRNLAKEQASDMYRTTYWAPFMEQEPDQRVANCALDAAVNMGPGTAKQLYVTFGHSLKEYQLARLLHYAATGKTQYFHSWFMRTLDV